MSSISQVPSVRLLLSSPLLRSGTINNTNHRGPYLARKPQLVQSTGDPAWIRLPQYVSVQLFRLSGGLRRKVVNAGAIADYVGWLSSTFGDPKVVPSTEKLWEMMAQRVTQGPVHGMEFGVAYGYGTDWWLKRIPNSSLRWDGFDRFTGLPRSWRFLDAGAYDAGGQTPDIDDTRVTWHVGEIEDKLEEMSISREEGLQFVVLFDLDIFEPSLVAWEYIRDSLRPGDLLYFDESFDADERRLLNEHILPSGKFECIGVTTTGMGLQVTGIDPR